MNTQQRRAQHINAILPPAQGWQNDASAFAPSNIALCKYWGKRDALLNLPLNASLSISLGDLGTHTQLTAAAADSVSLNGQQLGSDSRFYQKVFDFIDYFRRDLPVKIAVATTNTIPTAAGLASSASGFAALVLACNDFFDLNLDHATLSALARFGSGSAARSLAHGFVQWDIGTRADGWDSFAHVLPIRWEALHIGIVAIDSHRKKINSTEGMTRTLATSTLFQKWQQVAAADLKRIRQAIEAQDLTALGTAAEHNAMTMHATMLSAWPPLCYWQPTTLLAMQQVWQLREAGVAVYFTIDAGANLKLLFEPAARDAIVSTFPQIQIITPFNREPNHARY